MAARVAARVVSRVAATAAAAAALLAGCGTAPPVAVPQETFSSTATYSRSFVATQAQACEAARRALLSQGYVLTSTGSDAVSGRKSFQPDSEVHVQVEFRVVCAPEGPDHAIAFVSALQDRYALKKTNNSASLGVGALGSVSLPFTGSDDSLAKVASETISRPDFYDRFFQLVNRYLAADVLNAPAAPELRPLPAEAAPAPAPPPAPAPSPAPPAPDPEPPAPSSPASAPTIGG